jgi:8-oxo-dGTP pyrophosphatase MutT (NUDIX family)
MASAGNRELGGEQQRGGDQRIPRPASARPGSPPPWAHLSAEQRRFTVADVRRACASLPPPQRAAGPPGARPAAVLVAMFDEARAPGAPVEAHVILTKRPSTMASHQGEIAFPGGKLEPGVDHDLRDAALREAHEEIGLDPAAVEIVAELDSLVTVMGRFTLTPFVGLLAERPALVPHVTEVDTVFDVGLSELLDDATFREERWDIGDGYGVTPGPDRAIHFFELPDETVWGATARILTSFLEHLTSSA